MHYLYVVLMVFLRRRFVGVILQSELPPRLGRERHVQAAVQLTSHTCAYARSSIRAYALLPAHYPLDHRRRCLLPRGKPKHVVIVGNSTGSCQHTAHASHQGAVLYVVQGAWAVAVGGVMVGMDRVVAKMMRVIEKVQR